MSISTERFMHKPVDAIRVTDENIRQVAAWCQGEVKVYFGATNRIFDEDAGKRYIELSVSHPTGRRKAKAFAGDWIVAVKGLFKVYNHRAFESTFDSVPHVKDVQSIVMSTIMDAMAMMLTQGLSDDEKKAELIKIVEKGSSNVLDLL